MCLCRIDESGGLEAQGLSHDATLLMVIPGPVIGTDHLRERATDFRVEPNAVPSDYAPARSADWAAARRAMGTR